MPQHSAPPSPHLRDALALRAWALDVLAARAAGRQPLPPEAGAATWDLFLRSERCALPLRSRLASRSPSHPLPAAVAQPIERRATTELQRVLSARGELLEIRRLAGAHGLEPIVLKGGVATLSDDAPVDIADVDILVPREQADVLEGLLEERGYRAPIPGSAAHLPPRFTPGAVDVEVHFAIKDLDGVAELRARARPFPGSPGLWTLSPADHLWHLLVHSVVTHPYRRGSIRDVLLIQSAVRACTQAELEEVASRIARHSRSEPLGAMLDLARAMDGGAAPLDRFKTEAAANYILRSRFRGQARSLLVDRMSNTVFVLLGSAADRRAEWVEVWRNRRETEGSSWRLLAATERRWPRLGSTARRLSRAAALLVARPLAWPIAIRARRLALSATERRVGRSRPDGASG